MSGERQLGFSAALGLWAALGFVAAFYGTWLGYGGHRFAVTLGVFAILLAVALLTAARGVQERVAGLLGSHGGLAVALLPLPAYLIYALGTNSFAWWRTGVAAAYLLLPVLLVATARERPAGAWQDYAAVAALWIPVKFRWLYSLWPYPSAHLGYILTVLLALNVGIAAFLFVRRLDGVGYTVAWGRGTGRAVGLNFALLAAIVIPLGLAIGFLRFEPTFAHLKTLPLTALGIFLFTAWPEEFLFRGLLQNLLSKTFGGATLGPIAAAVIFGLAHITNNNVFPNWRYVLLATIAGIFYGRAWRRTDSIFASALVHALVNVTWHLLFRTW
ncbi:MAG: CPBP family intramembrane metalloprotease [Acidobacteria bacterium]|nr:CPBP family intramembrane metalloprotease [Acidobacteriota bacterium]